jgi:hypothetical protein
MKKQPEPAPIKTLRDAYKVRGFRVLAQLDSYDVEPPALALTLSRRAKKPCAAAAGKFAEASMTNAGGGRAIFGAGIAKSISISKCAASHAKPAA